MTDISRPPGVTIVGILYILGGLLLLLAGIVGAIFLGMAGLGGLAAAAGITFAILGIINIVIDIGCLSGWGWIWTHNIRYHPLVPVPG